MTRWARANNVHKHKPADATPWNQLRAGGSASNAATSSSGDRRGAPKQGPSKGTSPALRRTQSGQGIKKSKKKDLRSEDVNGFLDYLKQTGQPLPGGGQMSDPEFSEELNTALKKDKRREDRRVKRQMSKKNNMVKKCTVDYVYPHHMRAMLCQWLTFLCLWCPGVFPLQKARPRPRRLPRRRQGCGDGPGYLLPLRLC